MIRLRALILLGSLAIAGAQRPLNTTINGTAILTDPFFVKPTSIVAKLPYPEQRGGGGATYYSSVHDSPGIRNKERMPPPHPNSHLDIFIPPLNSVGGPQSVPPLPAPSSRLHSQKPRQNKVGQVRDLLKNSNMSKSFERKNVVRPEAYISTGPHDEQEKSSNGPSSEGKSIKALQKLRDDRIDQHTPSPPQVNMDEVDVDEKLGVKCSFEKPCAWTFDTNVTGPNFEVTTGVLLKESNVTGLLRNS